MARRGAQDARPGALVTVEDTFAKLVGRQASEAERTRLYRVRDALGLRDNDAFWSIVMALEHYDCVLSAVPGAAGRADRRVTREVRARRSRWRPKRRPRRSSAGSPRGWPRRACRSPASSPKGPWACTA